MVEPIIPLVVDLTVSENDNVYNLTVDGLTNEYTLSSASEIIRVSTDDYNDLINKPSINGVTLVGNLTLEDLITDFLWLDCGTSTRVV